MPPHPQILVYLHACKRVYMFLCRVGLWACKRGCVRVCERENVRKRERERERERERGTGKQNDRKTEREPEKLPTFTRTVSLADKSMW